KLPLKFFYKWYQSTKDFCLKEIKNFFPLPKEKGVAFINWPTGPISHEEDSSSSSHHQREGKLSPREDSPPEQTSAAAASTRLRRVPACTETRRHQPFTAHPRRTSRSTHRRLLNASRHRSQVCTAVDLAAPAFAVQPSPKKREEQQLE
ncbi:hypothetical protein Dimus_029629, partial [Dionaea muscipula]